MPDVTYMAMLPDMMYNPATGATITGEITGSRMPNGTGVRFDLKFSDFPSLSQYGHLVCLIFCFSSFHNHARRAGFGPRPSR